MHLPWLFSGIGMTRSIVWFRQDLRITDNPALSAAIATGAILPIYIDDIETPEDLSHGAASRVWLHHALNDLNKSLNNNLRIFRGKPLEIISRLIQEQDIDEVNWNRCYDKYQIKHDTRIKQELQNTKIKVNSFNASLLWEPWEIMKSDGNPYKVFTPYYRKGCLNGKVPRRPLPPNTNIQFINCDNNYTIDDLKLQPLIRWDHKILQHWDITEKAANKYLQDFISSRIYQYRDGRNVPSKTFTSKLSPYLHFGQISPHVIWDTLKNLDLDDNVDCFMSELGWREFSYYLLYHFPDLYKSNWNSKFDKFPWKFEQSHLGAWQRGTTGIPIVDAGMRELWQTGYMHNRVRMIVASFLTKNLLIDWRYGAKWFMDTLFDADIANNSASWQWVAGSGADAQPFFRIFNPILQSKNFDPDGIYIKKFVPELKNLPLKYLFTPWLTPKQIQQEIHLEIGRDYPEPIVDLADSRNIALASYKILGK